MGMDEYEEVNANKVNEMIEQVKSIQNPNSGKTNNTAKEKEINLKNRTTTKKAERPKAKTCQKVIPKTKSLIQVRVNYLNKNNKDKDNEMEIRNEESSPVKKKMKKDNHMGKKKEDSKNFRKDFEGSHRKDQINSKINENIVIKMCIDCNENYNAERNSKDKLLCLLCKFGDHGCIDANSFQLSRGHMWMCRECVENVKSPKMTNMVEKIREEIRTTGTKRKRNESESSEKNVEKEKAEDSNEEKSIKIRNKTNITKPNIEPNTSVRLKSYNISIDEYDILSVKGNNWISDGIIKLWMTHLQLTHSNNEKLLFVTPSISQMFKIGETKDLDKTLDSLEAWWKDYIFMPVNDNNTEKQGGNHWSLLVFSRQDNTWYHADSNHGSNQKNARHLVGKMNLYLNGNKHPEFIEVKCSQQNNNYDCGAYTMLFAQISARKAITGERQENLTVDKSDVTELREMISNIILIETKSIDKTERGMKVNNSKDIREFIASLCVEKEISKNTKRDILKFYDEKNYQENEDQKNKKEPVQQKREIVCRNWAKDKCIENYNCL